MDTLRLSRKGEFPHVQKYKDLAQQLGEQEHQEQECPDLFIYPDQEVPQLRQTIDEWEVKTDIKYEPNSPVFQSETLQINNSHIENQLPSFLTSQSVYEGINNNQDVNNNSKTYEANTCHQFNVTHSVDTSSNTSPLLSSAAFPPCPSYSTDSLVSQSYCENNLKSRNFVSEVAGSGCTVLTSDKPECDWNQGNTTTYLNFLNNDSTSSSNFSFHDLTPPSLSESINFLDLDKQQDNLSFYDENEDIKPFNNDEDLQKMRNELVSKIQYDCNKLNIPINPVSWSTQDVSLWINHLCQTKGLLQPILKYDNIDGRCLCSLNWQQLEEIYGQDLGQSVSKELDLLQSSNNPPFESSHQESSVMEVYQELTADLPASVFHSLPATVHRPASPSSSSSCHELDSMDSTEEEDNGTIITKIEGNKTGKRGHKQTIHLWQFLRELLHSEATKDNCIRWINEKDGIFKIEDSKTVAKLWGQRKNRPAMNYDKLSRSVRQYYKKGIIKKTQNSKRLVYQFCAGYL